LSTLVFALPVLALTRLQLDSIREQEIVVARELAGLDGLQAGVRLLAGLHDARRQPGPAAERRVGAEVAGLERVAADSEGVALRAESRRLRNAWVAPHDRGALERTGRAGADFMAALAAHSALTFDGRADVANLADESAARLPLALVRLDAAAHRAAGASAAGAVPASERTAVEGLLAEALADLNLASDDRLLAIDANPQLRGELHDVDAAFEHAVSRLVSGLDDFAHAQPSRDTSVSALAAASDAVDRTSRAALAARLFRLERILDARGSELEAQRESVIVYAAIGMIGGVGVLFFLARLLIYRARRHVDQERERALALENRIARERAERARVLTEAQFRAIFERSPLGIATLDRDGNIVECNPRFIAIAGDRVPLVSAQEIAQIANGEVEAFQDERPLTRPDAGDVWIAVSVSPVLIEDSSIAAIAMVEDVTERRQLSDRLHHQATHDALTALPGRALFIERVNTALAGRREPARSTAVMLIDLDRFKLVNDTLGHATGDRFLIAVGQRLLGAVRPRDIVARFHGDEFAILLPDIERHQALMIGERIQRLMRTPLTIDGKRILGGVSVGIALARPHDTAESTKDADELLREADAALYRAKAGGRARGVLFNDEMRASFERRTRLANDLRNGIPEEQLALRYQPIVRLDDERPVAYEVLATWRHPELGEITPSEFIPIAEESDAIVQFGDTVLREACRRLAGWTRTIPGASDVTLNVNLSGRQVLDESLIEDVCAAVREYDLAPERITFEVTENVLLDGDEVTSARLRELKALGFGLCLDDFGIGYSSLRYLHQFPFDVLKIDRSFVSSDDGALSNEPIVTMLITLAEALGLQLVAEGIEHPAQRDRLHALGCVLGQGFLFGRGLSAPEATERMHSRTRVPLRLVR
jgi:diguanylate cyclase (GGDEF)-like protein